MVEDQACCVRMRIQLAVRPDNAPLCRGHLSPDINHFALSSHDRNPLIQSTNHVYLELQRGVALAGG
jgi:hypothetical protein